jgi:hypothetical protein
MTDSSPTDAVRAATTPIDPGRDAKIDELLLAGLECYFAGGFHEAINVWGRVLFLDRRHPRARAYIERARSALAEGQRRSEELASEGVAAIRRGDGGGARELLASAAAHGESPDVALAYLERFERLAGVPGERNHESRRTRRIVARPGAATAVTRLRHVPRPVRTLPLVGLVVVVGALIVFAATYDLLKPLVEAPWTKASGPVVTTVAPEPLPLPRAADLVLARARALFTSGHLGDALVALDAVSEADPVYPEAERLRADVQRAMLEAAGVALGGENPRRGPGA